MARQTKHILAESLMHIMETKPLSKITIVDITEDCGVSRMTFYYHFQDIYDLLSWIFLDQARQIIQETKFQTWQDLFLALCRTVVDNRDFVSQVYRSVSLEQIMDYLYQFIHGMIMSAIQQHEESLSVAQSDQEFIADFYTYAFSGITLSWVKDGMSTPPETLTRKISTLAQGQIPLTLRKFIEQNQSGLQEP